MIARRVALVLASGFGTGFFPVAPATFASLILFLILGLAAGWRAHPNPWLVAACIAGVGGIGVWASSRAERVWGMDARRIVIDELVGVLVAVWGFPLTPAVLGLGFLLFRFMDVVKPPPAYQVQSLPRGWGVMADDLIAGIYSQLGLRLLALAGILHTSAGSP